MDTLRDRLSELAEDAPTGGAPPAELWARGKRAQRIRATAFAAAALVVGAVGTGIGIGLADAGPDRSDLAPARTVGFALPITYPEGAALPDLGNTPGPLAAVWLVPREGDTLEAVGLVAKTGTFGRLPIDLPRDDPEAPWNLKVALSPDGRRIAYPSAEGQQGVQDAARNPIVRDLVSGETHTWAFGFDTRGVGLWADATHLFGHVAGGSDGEGWLWEPGQSPTRVNPYDVSYVGSEVSVASWPALMAPTNFGDGSGSCTTLSVYEGMGSPPADVPALCNVLGVIGSDVLLGHRHDARDSDGTVVALQFDATTPFCPSPPQRCTLSVNDAHRRVVATAGAPGRVTFATDLIGAALDAKVGRS